MTGFSKWSGRAIGAAALLSGASQAAMAQTAAESAAQEEQAQTAPDEQESPADATAVTLGQEQEEEVVVTGSRILRNDASSLGPLTTITNQDIAFTAPSSVGDIVQTLPNVGVNLNSNGTQGTSFGVSTINLRYLGSAEGSGNRTLVLVDGHRWVNAVGGRGFRDFVDLNTIPLGMVERIEVLKDGASAIYGADAIAGVVNIQTRRRVDGVQANVRVGITERGDNQNVSGYLNFGHSFGRLSALVSLTYSDTAPLLTTDRALTRRALTPLTAPPTSPRGLFVLPGIANNAYFGTPANFGQNAANALTRIPGFFPGSGASADNAFRVARLPDDDYNTQAQGIYATGPSERYGAFGRLSFEVTPDIDLYAEALYNNRKSSQLFSPFLLDIRGSNGFTISRDQAFNPFGTANGVPTANAVAFSGNTFRIQRVAVEVGNRDNVQEVETWRFAAGINGKVELFGKDWRWDSFASYSKNSATFDALNQINLESLYRSLHSPALCAASPGCVPLNIFGEITPEMANYIRYDAHDENRASQIDFTANLSGALFSLPGGEVGFATGYEYRKERAVDEPDAFAATLSSVLPLVGGARQLPTTAQSRDPTRGSYDLHEVYAELNLPILADIPGFYRLDVDAAARYSHYSTVGGKLTTKIGASYKPVPDFMVRGTYAQGFRAPSILELYQGSRQTNFQAVDPCNGGGAGLPGCAGVPTSYNQNQFGSGAISGVTAGNVNLEAETADTFSAGAAFTPTFLPRFSLTVDWFRINVKNAIAAQSAAQILTACARTGNFCDLVQRAATGEVVELRQAVVNLSRIEVEGVDATARYAHRVGGGTVEAAIDVAYLDKFRTFTPQPDGTVLVDDRAGLSDQPRSTFPHWKGQASLRYVGEAIGAGWRTRYIGSSKDIPGNAVNGGRITDVLYHDVQLNFTIPGDRMTFALGVDNVFDRQPPASAANNPINFDIYTYDIRGRYFYATAGVRF
jgi:iron complex outermembrane receptor protein